MITDNDVKKLKKVFVTKDDLDKKFDRKFKENNEILIKEITGLFNSTNERIDNVLKKLEDHQDDIDNHERRIEKLEDKAFAT